MRAHLSTISTLLTCKHVGGKLSPDGNAPEARGGSSAISILDSSVLIFGAAILKNGRAIQML